MLSVTMDKQKVIKLEQQQAIKSREYKLMINAIRASSMSAMDYESEVGEMTDSDKDEGDGEEEDGYIPRSLKDLMEDKKAKKPQPAPCKSNLDRVEELSAAPTDSQPTLVRKACKLMKLLARVDQKPHKAAAEALNATLQKQVKSSKIKKETLIEGAKLYKKFAKTADEK